MASEGRRSLQVGATRGCLDPIQDLIESVAADAGVSGDPVIRFESAAMEVVGNVVEHAAAVQPVQLSVTVEIADGWFRGLVEDDGPSAPIDLAAVDMPEDMSDHGRGLAIVVGMLDEFKYERRGQYNVWRLGVSLSSDGGRP